MMTALLVALFAGGFFLLLRSGLITTTTARNGHGPVLFAGTLLGASAKGRGRLPLIEGVRQMATTIAKFETGVRGPFSLDPTKWKGRARTNLNPGNLRFGFQRKAIGVDKENYSRFSSALDGWNALLADVKAKITGRGRTGLGPDSSLEQFVHVYAPASENPTGEYIKFVAGELGISPSTKFREWIEV